MPPKVVKSRAHSCLETLTKLFNHTMHNSEFPDELKLAEVTTILMQQNGSFTNSFKGV